MMRPSPWRAVEAETIRWVFHGARCSSRDASTNASATSFCSAGLINTSSSVWPFRRQCSIIPARTSASVTEGKPNNRRPASRSGTVSISRTTRRSVILPACLPSHHRWQTTATATPMSRDLDVGVNADDDAILAVA